MRVTPLDLSDAAAFAELHALYRARMEHDLPDQAVLDTESLRAAMSAAQPHTDLEHWVARIDGRIVGYVDLVLPLTENRANIHSAGYVHPGQRRRGIGTALYRQIVARAEALGRTNLTAMVDESTPGGFVRHDGAGAAFLLKQGLERVLVEYRRRLDIASVDEQALESLDNEAQKKASDYEILTWSDRADDALATDLAHLEERLHIDLPTGDLDWDPVRYDVDRWRQLEDMGARRLRTVHYAAARHRISGKLAAYTGFMLPKQPRTHARQVTTVVLPEHRGHRLGLLVKLANLRYAREREPRLRYIDTYNAEGNSHMIAINEAMGFVLCDAGVDFQGDIR